jgi:putative ABC transport system substrate-binding protein
MRRRDFITVLGGTAAMWSLTARAQQPKSVSRVGMLSSGPAMSPVEEELLHGLTNLRYVQGQNLIFEFRGAAGRADRLAELAAELVASRVDVIFASGSEATRAARQKTTSIPIVTISTNPVGLGLVASLARPGGNITGLSLLGPEVSGKRLELLKEFIPGIAKVAAFWNPNDPGAQFSLKETQTAAETLAVKLQALETRDINAFAGAFQAATRESAAAVILLPAPLMSESAARIADLALQHRMPTLSFSDHDVKAGALISYGASIVAAYRRGAYFVDRILKGANPAELPVEQPTQFDLVINLKTANAIGLNVPPALLARADEVIE